jgi:hypothetical protein
MASATDLIIECLWTKIESSINSDSDVDDGIYLMPYKRTRSLGWPMTRASSAFGQKTKSNSSIISCHHQRRGSLWSLRVGDLCLKDDDSS